MNKINISSNKQKLIIYIILTVATLAVFWQVNQFDFVNIDDPVYVTKNNHIQSGITLERLHWAYTTTHAEFWHPLTWMSLMLDYQLYGLKAGGYHLTNLILHILSTLLLFWLFNRMTGEIWKSAFVAAFFALHPLHVESVAWIAERKDVLSAFFWMLTLCLYVYYTEKPAVKKYLLVLFSFICALMSKPMVVTLPVIMILLDYWPLRRFESKKENRVLWQLKEKLPFFILSAVFSLVTIHAQYRPIGRDLQFPLSSRVANALVSFVTYLEKTILPHDLAAFYPFPNNIPLWQVLGAIILITVISAIVFAKAKRLPYLFTGWLWYAITMAPVIGIIPIGDFAMADRYTYLPLIGIAVGIAWGLPLFFRNDNLRKIFLFPAAIAFIFILSVLSWQQCGYWENDVKLFNHTLQVTKNNYLAHINLGSALSDEGRTQEAIDHYNEAIRIMPNLVLSYNTRGIAYAKLGQYQQAFDDFNKAILLKPDYADAYYSRGTIYNKLGRYQQAVEDLSEALRLNSYNSPAYFNRGNAYINLGLYQKAIEDITKVITLNPDSAEAYNNRAFIYIKLGQYQQAIENYAKAIHLKPDYADAYNNRAFVYLSLGDNVSACKDARKACDLGDCSTLQAVTSRGLCR
jgi:Flp pilus assembly protein TadD